MKVEQLIEILDAEDRKANGGRPTLEDLRRENELEERKKESRVLSEMRFRVSSGGVVWRDRAPRRRTAASRTISCGFDVLTGS